MTDEIKKKIDEAAEEHCKKLKPLDWTVEEKQAFLAGANHVLVDVEGLVSAVDHYLSTSGRTFESRERMRERIRQLVCKERRRYQRNKND